MKPDEFLSRPRLDELLDQFPQSSIAVVGDFFLDEYLVLDKSLSEISLETGLEAYQVVGTRKSPGAAGTVTNILRSLDVPVMAIGFSGDDGHGFELRRALNDIQVNLEHFATFPGSFTPTYTKPMLRVEGRETELSRQDTKNRQPLPADCERQMISSLRQVAQQVKAILVCDQVQERNCGVITDRMRAELAEIAEQYPHKVIMVDSRERMGDFRNLIVKFNVNEAAKTLGIQTPEVTPEGINRLSRKLFERYQRPIILTLGDQGMQVTDASVSARIPAIPVSGPIDIVGAGDSVLASMGAALSVGASLIEAGMIGVVAASLIVQQIGTTGVAPRQKVKARFEEAGEWLNARVHRSGL